MKTETFSRRSRIAASAEALYRWHASPGALAQLVPPWEPVEVLTGADGLEEGKEVRLRIRLGPFRRLWVSRLMDCVPGRGFRDVQVRGPFLRWEHEHRMEPDGPEASFLEDRIVYGLPLGALGHLVAGRFVRRRLERMFEYRHRVTAEALSSLDSRRE